jgi:putative membrane protein
MLRWLLAAFHLLALGIGLGAISVRAWALRPPLRPDRLPLVFLADTAWGVAALLWISTGLWRAFGGVEKGSAYYLGSSAFRIKMGMLALILLLEVWPMITLIRWRAARARGVDPALDSAPALSRISVIQALLVVAMVFAATAMARGLGY